MKCKRCGVELNSTDSEIQCHICNYINFNQSASSGIAYIDLDDIDIDTVQDPNITYGIKYASAERARIIKQSRINNLRNGVNINVHPSDDKYIPSPTLFPDITIFRHKILAKSFNQNPDAWVEGCSKWEVDKIDTSVPDGNKPDYAADHNTLLKYMMLYCSVEEGQTDKKLRPECITSEIFNLKYNQYALVALTLLLLISQAASFFNIYITIATFIIMIILLSYIYKCTSYAMPIEQRTYAQNIISTNLSSQFSSALSEKSIDIAWITAKNNMRKNLFKSYRPLLIILLIISLIINIGLIITTHTVAAIINIVLIYLYVKSIYVILAYQSIPQSDIDELYITINRKSKF